MTTEAKVIGLQYDNTSTVTDLIADGSFDPGYNFFERDRTRVYPEWDGLSQIRPGAQLTVYDLSEALSWCGHDGLQLDTYALNLYTVDTVHGGQLASDGQKIGCDKGMVVPDTLRLQDGALAQLDYQVVLGNTSGTAPFSVSDSTTAPDLTIDERFTLGSVTLGGTDIGPVQSVAVTFGWNVRQIFGDGSPFPQGVNAMEMNPNVTIQTNHPDALTDVTVSGSTSAVSITAQKTEDGAERAGSGDITITFDKQLVTVDTINLPDGTPVGHNINVRPASTDGSTKPISISGI